MDHSYTMTQWQDAPSTETPLNAENLNHIEQGIGAIYHDVGVLEESLSTFIVADLLPTETHGSGESSYTSEHDYSADDLMIIGTKIYKALSAIAVNGTIYLPDSGSTANVSEITQGEAIVKLASGGEGGGDASTLETRVNALETSVNNIINVEIPYLRTRIDNIDTRSSHIGQIIQSTTLDTMAKVINVYGGITWIQHSGYMLYGSSSEVSSNNPVKDGGESTHTLTVEEMPTHNHKLGSRSIYANGGLSGALVNYDLGDANDGQTGYVGGGAPHNNMPPYKNVYIWERTA